MSASAHLKKFGTAPVFFTAISTILGAIMFLRFGFAIGNVGLVATIAIVLLGHMVTIPTALALAEIATNQKVEGGGEYFIISRSFGLVIGSSIGIALYFSQAISVAFYIIAFAEAFKSLTDYILLAFPDMSETLKWILQKKQTVSIPALLILTVIMLYKGADLGVKALYTVVATLFISLIAFFIGDTGYAQTAELQPFSGINEFSFFAVFAIIFPAFTGMTAGVGLSGDLKNPSRSIPIGTISATIGGMIIYLFIAYKLYISASPADLANTDNLVMAQIAWQGSWLIPIGLAAATVSSALGSLMVAPRTLQAIAKDRILPTSKINYLLSRGKGKSEEPFNATVVTILIAFVFVLLGELNMVAAIISMFFMVTYGSLCLISFLQHFAADPSYRPSFKSKWYFSLFGAIACFALMFFMNPGYAFLAIFMMIGLYLFVSYYNPDKRNIALIFQGAIFQISRQMQIFLQKADKEKSISWRPSVVCISEFSFERIAALDLLRWISQKYGFGTYIHKINGYLSKETSSKAKEAKIRLIKMADQSKSNVYMDTMISPSDTSAIAQVIQLPGISGSDNNLLLLEFSKRDPVNLDAIVDNFNLVKSVDFDVAVLASSERGFGLKKQIHIWITDQDYENANLMILLGYIVLGHKDWQGAVIKIIAIYPELSLDKEKENLFKTIEEGKLPISKSNIVVLTQKEAMDTRAIITDKSKDADLVLVGVRSEMIKHKGRAAFEGYDDVGNVLFVNTSNLKILAK
jgi:amino acid transporter